MAPCNGGLGSRCVVSSATGGLASGRQLAAGLGDIQASAESPTSSTFIKVLTHPRSTAHSTTPFGTIGERSQFPCAASHGRSLRYRVGRDGPGVAYRPRAVESGLGEMGVGPSEEVTREEGHENYECRCTPYSGKNE